MENFSSVSIGGFMGGHVQGIAIEKNREYIYLSFTTGLVKIDLQGNIIGSVKGIVGHLGCLAYNYSDGMVYGSLEYKNDSIGKGILRRLNEDIVLPDSFYIVCFDVEKITRPDMDAEKDGIMKAVYLKEVYDDYKALGHRYGCSGIDGVTFAPKIGETDGNLLYVAYGIYGDVTRKDNDHQIILCYDTDELKNKAQPLNQDKMHTEGPEKPLNKYFVFTGNTNYGIQNLEYDKYNNCIFAAVYPGKKFKYPNYSMFAVDLNRTPEYKKLKGLEEKGEQLSLKKFPFFKSRAAICGCKFPYGSTGMISLGENKFLFSEDFHNENGYGTTICAYTLDENNGFQKTEIIL